jgi:hypothetical protein
VIWLKIINVFAVLEEHDDDVPEIDVFEHRRHKNNKQIDERTYDAVKESKKRPKKSKTEFKEVRLYKCS